MFLPVGFDESKLKDSKVLEKLNFYNPSLQIFLNYLKNSNFLDHEAQIK